MYIVCSQIQIAETNTINKYNLYSADLSNRRWYYSCYKTDPELRADVLSLGGQNTQQSGATKVTQKVIVHKEEIHFTGCCILAKKKSIKLKRLLLYV